MTPVLSPVMCTSIVRFAPDVYRPLVKISGNGGPMSQNYKLTRFCRSMIAMLATVCIVLSGCQAPPWGPPGTIGAQRARAMVHDPYPSTDLAPPIAGGRPLGYDQPPSEATSLQSSPYARRSLRGGQFVPTFGF